MPACNVVTSSALVAKDCATWSSRDQQRWKELFDPEMNWGDTPWVRAVQYQIAGVYTRYLASARAVAAVVGQGITSGGLKAFIKDCELRGCCPRTIAGYTWDLTKLSAKLWPSRNRDWLFKTCTALDRVARRTAKRKLGRIADSAEIRMMAERLLAKARDLGPKGGWEAILLYRDGLFALLGAYDPERRRALATIRLDQIDFDECVIRFDAEQIKTGEPSIRHLPPNLVEDLKEWIDVWRRQANAKHGMLWVKKGGGPVGDAALAVAFGNATERELGIRLSPHRLRDGAATLIVEDSPNSVPIARHVLGHKSEHMIQEYTETANQIEAGRQYGAAIDATWELVERRVRQATRSTVALNPCSKRISKRSR